LQKPHSQPWNWNSLAVTSRQSDALVPLVRSRSAKDEHAPPSRTARGDLLGEAMEALCCQVTNTTNKHSPDSPRAFLTTVSALSTLPAEDFRPRLY
jgi:hypothetical protein